MSIGAQVNERLAALTEAGVSVWLDQIRRGLIVTGELQRLVEEDSLRGVTSNPAIFEKAILGSDDYDADIEKLARDGLAANEIYLNLAIKDVQMGCDVLRPVHDATDGRDGFVSLEVEPSLAHDTEGTLKEARELWKAVDRPNVMIKIPGTPEGLPAVEDAIADGIFIGMETFGESGPYKDVYEHFGITAERIAETGRSVTEQAAAARS